MRITDVRIKLMDDEQDRLLAFCSVTFDNGFVVRDLKIIDGINGPFVAMPSRKVMTRCPQCGCKNHLRAHYCNQCGKRLHEEPAPRDQDGRVVYYLEIAHPINRNWREMIRDSVISEYEAERERAQHPDYVSRYDDYFDLDDATQTAPSYLSEAPIDLDSTARHTPHFAGNPPHLAPSDGERQPVKPIRQRGNEEFGRGVFP
jgi:stage V sporulation protein G